ASSLPDDFYRVGANGSTVLDASATALDAGIQVVVNRLEDQVPVQVVVSLDPASDTGVSNSDGLTNDTTPTFDVQVNQAGTITVDYEGNGTVIGSLYAPAAGTYQLTAPTLPAGTYTASANFFALTGPPGQRATTYTLDTTGPRVTSMSPSGTVNNRLSQVTVTFSEALDPSTWTTSAIALSGPGGAVTVNSLSLVSGNTYRINFPAQS